MAEVTKYGFTGAMQQRLQQRAGHAWPVTVLAHCGLCLSCCVGVRRHSKGILLAGLPHSVWCCDLKVSRPFAFI